VAERLSALAEAYPRGDLGAARGDPGIIIAERRPLAMVQVTALSDAAATVRAAIAAALGIMVAATPNHAIQKDGVTILWVGPDRWLVVEPDRPGRELVARLSEALTSTPAVLVDLSHGRTVFRITGRCSRDLLAKDVASIFIHVPFRPAAARKAFWVMSGRFCMQSMRHPASIFTLRVASP